MARGLLLTALLVGALAGTAADLVREYDDRTLTAGEDPADEPNLLIREPVATGAVAAVLVILVGGALAAAGSAGRGGEGRGTGDAGEWWRAP